MKIKNKVRNNLIISLIDEKPEFEYISLNQVHGDKVFFAEDYKEKDKKGDGLITRTGKILCVKTADCIPLVILTENPLFYGIFHVGWRSLFKGIIKKGIREFLKYGFNLKNLYAYLGPSICSNCYEVGIEFKDFDNQFLFKRKNKFFYDLRGKSVYELLKMGVKNIHLSSLCTFEKNFLPSYRRDKNKRRIFSFVMPYKI
ncbi:MAG: polyphenol oxidase family protein [candidate division WOR-3 bacterium]